MKNRKIYAVTVLLLFLLGLFPTNMFASEFNFAVIPVIPDNQIDKQKTYFDLKMDSGQKQELEVNLRNDTEKELTIETQINSATTNANGVVEYGLNDKKPDDSLVYNLKELVDYPKETKVPAKSSAVVKINVEMPDQAFDGVLAGGITFQEKPKKEDETADSSEGKGLSIKNEFSYIVGLLIRQNENNVTPDLILHSAKAGQVNARNVVSGNLQNPTASYINQLKMKAEVTKKGDNTVLYSAEGEQMQVAPNSNFDYSIPLKGDKLEAGEYTYKVTAYGMKAEDGMHKVKNAEGEEVGFEKMWEQEKNFSITKAQAKEYNEKDVMIEKEDNSLYFWLGGGLLLLALLLLAFLIYRSKKKRQQQIEEERAKQLIEKARATATKKNKRPRPKKSNKPKVKSE